MAKDALAVQSSYEVLGKELLRRIHSLMVGARVLEERLIKMSKSGDGFFLDWGAWGGSL